MTKKEQIYEIAKYVCNACEFGIYGACSKRQTDIKSCSLALGTAKRIYNAGYRKVLLDTENGSCVDCIQYVPWQLVERKIEELKSENKQLKTECALLDDELRIARQETINVLNELKGNIKNAIDTYYNSQGGSYYSSEDVINDIDKLIKEFINENQLR